ncbi:hypothetical protein D3C71_1729910 [compost metagenome]
MHGGHHVARQFAALGCGGRGVTRQLRGLTCVIGVLFHRRGQLFHAGGRFFQRGGLLLGAGREIVVAFGDFLQANQDRLGTVTYRTNGADQRLLHAL